MTTNSNRIVKLSAAIMSMALLLSATTRAQERRLLRGHVPKAATMLEPIDRLAASNHLKLAVGLPLRNEEALQNLLRQQYDPASSNYRRWQTPAQLAEQFGPTEADYQTVKTWANSKGLKITGTHPNRLVLDLEGAVPDIERALNVTLRVFNHPTEPRTFHAPDCDPSIESTVPILNIAGLSDYALPRPNHHLKTLSKANRAPRSSGSSLTPSLGSAPEGGFGGCDFRTAYAPGVSLTGTGQGVGLLQFDGFYQSDIAAYEEQFGLPAIRLVTVAVDGGVDTPGDGNGEVCLDIEMILAMAPGISTIYVYEAPNPSPWIDLLNRMHQDNFVKQFSCSWGGGPPDPTAEHIFQLMAAAGQSFFNASGDSDAFTGEIPFPSDSPNITEVGGTTLSTTGPCGSYSSEMVWNWGLQGDGNFVGSSGGISPTYSIPVWQQGIDMSVNLGSTFMRNTPDVAMTADNVFVCYNGGDIGIFGGTSCAAPLWAGFTALVNQQAQASGIPAVGFLNPGLYAIGKERTYSTAFHDVTLGDNVEFLATSGYDLCTGWGSPAGAGLINLLAPPIRLAPITIQIVGAGTVTPNYNGQSLTVGKTYTITAKAAPGFAFRGWSGSFSASSLTLSFSMQPDLTLTANFVDIIPPTLKIASPKTGQHLSNSVAILTGTASDNVSVGRVYCQLNGQNWSHWSRAFTANGWADWNATLNLVLGVNIISAYSVDAAGNFSPTSTVSVTYIASDVLRVRASGQGSVSPNYNDAWLQIGKAYLLTATPATGCLFSNWVDGAGHVLATTPTLHFIMGSNLVLQANFVPNPFTTGAGNYAGLFYVTNNQMGVTPTNAGFISVTMTKSGSFTAKLQQGARSYPMSGQFSLSDDWSANLAPASAGLSLALHLDTARAVITGQLRSPTWTAELIANLNRKTCGEVAPGKYTLILPGIGDGVRSPAGSGFASLSLTPAGVVTLTGTLGDGTKISQSTFLSAEGQIPFYSSLNAGGGLVIGWLTFTNDVDTLNDLEGMVNWIKPAQASATRTYPNGFAFGVANGIEAQGALWINTQPLLNSRNGVVAFTGGGLNQPTFDSISVDANGKITDLTRTNALVLTLTASSGLFAGSFTATDGTMRHINFSGAIHQKQGKGYGQFLGADQSGNVSIRFTP